MTNTKIVKESEKVSRLVYLSETHKFLSTELKRDTDASRLNAVANHPDVYRWVHGSYVGYMDLTPLVANPHNYLIMGKHGGVLFTRHQPGMYEAHTQMLPEGRGEWALNAVRGALMWLFTKTDAVEVMTKVPKGNLGARALVRSIHGSFEFRRENGWVIDGQSVPADIFALTIQNWMRTGEGLTERGEWFHNRLEEEFSRVGYSEPTHPVDPVHDRYVGGAVEMVLGGQPHKAVILYNRWAVMAGYSPIQVVTNSPLVMDIDSALLAVRNNDFWVMACR